MNEGIEPFKGRDLSEIAETEEEAVLKRQATFGVKIMQELIEMHGLLQESDTFEELMLILETEREIDDDTKTEAMLTFEFLSGHFDFKGKTVGEILKILEEEVSEDEI